MRRRRQEEDEHTIKYNFPWNQTKGLFITLIRSINTKAFL